MERLSTETSVNNTDQDPTSISVRPAGHLLARNVLFNIIGQALPIIIAFYSIPALIHSLGTEKFGVLALAWVLAGYFNLFDLGLGRAVVRIVVQKIPLRNTELFQAIWAAFSVATVLGVFGGATLYFSAEWLTVHFFSVNDQLHEEVVGSLRVIGVVIPFVVSSTIFRGALEAFQKFDWINYVQVPIGMLTYLLPLLMSTVTQDLPWIIGTLVLTRLSLWASFLLLCARCLRSYPKKLYVRASTLRELLSFGFWISMSNFIQPFLSYLDRFLIGSIISMVAVAYYTAPMEIVLKLWILPGAVISVIYPAFSAHLTSVETLRTLYFRSTRFLIIALGPICFSLSVMSEEILRLWINSEYAHESARVLSILSLGIFANCVGFVPAAFLQAVGKPSVPAKFHVVEFPLYAALLFIGLKIDGVVGAAGAWVVRVVADSLALHYAALSRLEAIQGLMRAIISVTIFFVAAIVVSELPIGLRIITVLSFWAGSPLLGWYFVLSVEDQKYLLNRLLHRNGVENPRELRRHATIHRVGIAMAVYAPEPTMFLRQLESLKSQTFSNWVCIMTSDSPVEHLYRDARVMELLRDPRFILRENLERIGATKNFERAVQLTLEEDIDALALCDQDDIWYAQKLESLIRSLERTPVGSLVHCDMRVVQHHSLDNVVIANSAWKHEDRRVEDQKPLHFLVRNCVTGAACLMDVSIAKRYWRIPDSFRYHDQWYALVASTFGGVHPVFEVLYDYVQHGSNAVGIVPYQGFFYRPPGVSWNQLVKRSVESWNSTCQMAGDFENQGFRLGKVERMWAKKTLAGAGLFLFVGILTVRIDSSFARACLIKGIGGVASKLGVGAKDKQ